MQKTLVDLFAGAGGLSCGLSLAGFRSILANELEPIYAETFRHNNPGTDVVVGDIRELSESDIRKWLGVSKGDITLLAGGPPCQGFSVNAPIRSLDDDRNHLFKEFIRIASELLPQAILIENVPGIISLGKGTVVKEIYKALNALGYRVDHKILFAGHYGIPQMRFRTVFLALRSPKANIQFPPPVYDAQAVANFAGAKELCMDVLPLFSGMLKPHTPVGDVFSDLPELNSGQKTEFVSYTSAPLNEYQKKLRNAGSVVSNHSCNSLGTINLQRLKHIPQGGSWRDIPFELLPAGLKRARRSDHTKRYGRLDPGKLCSTVLTKCDPHWGSFFHPEQDRVISVREAARIQSFPDSYEFTGSITQQYEQVGNAVPPLMAEAIGKTLGEAISGA